MIKKKLLDNVNKIIFIINSAINQSKNAKIFSTLILNLIIFLIYMFSISDLAYKSFLEIFGAEHSIELLRNFDSKLSNASSLKFLFYKENITSVIYLALRFLVIYPLLRMPKQLRYNLFIVMSGIIFHNSVLNFIKYFYSKTNAVDKIFSSAAFNFFYFFILVLIFIFGAFFYLITMLRAFNKKYPKTPFFSWIGKSAAMWLHLLKKN
jgi:hypothetical protein